MAIGCVPDLLRCFNDEGSRGGDVSGQRKVEIVEVGKARRGRLNVECGKLIVHSDFTCVDVRFI
jgi:hypothetical protein